MVARCSRSLPPSGRTKQPQQSLPGLQLPKNGNQPIRRKVLEVGCALREAGSADLEPRPAAGAGLAPTRPPALMCQFTLSWVIRIQALQTLLT